MVSLLIGPQPTTGADTVAQIVTVSSVTISPISQEAR